MKDLSLIEPRYSDLLIENFDLKIIDGAQQIAQNLAIRLRFFLGEWFLDVTQGIPYYEDIFIKGAVQYRVESILKQEIVNTEGVREILRFVSNFEPIKRQFSVDFACDTDQGQINLELDLL